MTNYFSWLADELTDIEERLSEPDLVMFSGSLRQAINKAFVKACEADREQRQAKERALAEAKAETAPLSVAKRKPRVAAEPPYIETPAAVEWRPGGGATGGVIRVRVKTSGQPKTAPISGSVRGRFEESRAEKRAEGAAALQGAAAPPKT